MKKCSMHWSLALLLLGAASTQLLRPAAVAAQQGVASEAAQVDLGTLQWRNVGPFRGGRASAVAGTTADPLIFYMGTAGGGVYKTTNAGLSWVNISDGHLKTASVGAIAVAPSNPNIIYVGMGEHTARVNTVHHGDGVYKSTDAGKTWTHMGLAPTQVISRIHVHPQNPNLVYVAAQGALYGPTQERGIYRSTDGGATWRRMHFVGETAGAADLSMDPTNAKVLYSAYWDHQRFPWEIRQYGPLGGVYKSTDGGDTWQKLTNGLPATMGKVSVAATSNPNRVYALLATQVAGRSGLYRSDDAGANWSLINSQAGLTGRQWYYIEVFADPTNPDQVFVLNSTMYRSTDGGRTVTTVPTPHGDRHEFWINPTNPKFMAVADDGGGSVSLDGGVTWSPEDNQPTAQIYRVVADNQFPYRLYGAQQDNTTISIASATLGRSGIGPQDWHPVAGYENSWIALDPDNPDLVYGTMILGEVEERSQSTNVSRMMSPYAMLLWGNSGSRYMKYRHVLNVPIFMSRHPRKILYLGAQKLLASDDRGMTWREISPDVTLWGTDPKRDKRLGTAQVGDGAYGAISYMAESPLRADVLWTGSDDGLVGVTRDGGNNWHLTPLPGMGDARINALDPSPHDPATAYVAVNRFWFNDYAPYFFKTSDYGRNWTRIGANLPHGGFARVIREDPVRKGLLYAGTELGVHVSLDDGKTWRPLMSKLPVTPIYDLKVHQNDLIVATGGRAFWILDDVTLLRELDAGLRESTVRLFRPRPAYRAHLAAGGSIEPGTAFGQNPPAGAILNFYLPRRTPTTIEVLTSSGTVVRRLVTADNPDPSAVVIDARAGMNRLTWDLRQTPIPLVSGVGGGPGQGRVEGHLVAPGTYTIKLTSGGTSVTAPLEIRAMPSVRATTAEYAAQEQLLNAIEKDLLEYRDLARQVESVRAQIADVTKKLADSTALEASRTYSAKLDLPTEIYRHLAYVHARVNGVVPNARPSYREMYALLHNDWEAARPAIRRALGADLIAFNATLAKLNHSPIKPVVPPDRRQDTRP